MADVQPGSVITPGGAKPETNWQFQATETKSPDIPQAPIPNTPTRHDDNTGAVSWTASEFIAHDKSAGWYLLLTIITLAGAAIVYFLSNGDKVSTVVVAIAAIAFGAFASRKPRELQYVLDNKGIHIGEKFYPYVGFRSFAIVQEEAIESIWLMPLKRFMPIIAIYFDSQHGKQIADTLSQFLPAEDRKPDAVDKLMHRIRF